jgi:PAS domain-containing protein
MNLSPIGVHEFFNLGMTVRDACNRSIILDTIPTLAWCNLPDGSNDFVNQRWCDYTGLSPEEVQRWVVKS